MRTFATHASAAALALASVLLHDRPAAACGGCFHNPAPQDVTVVTGHRMAFSISTQQSILWDQIQYSGSPADFAWVLPVRPGAKVELSHDEWFAALDTLTTPTITGPNPGCGGSAGPNGSAFSCGSNNGNASSYGAASGFGDDGGGNGVNVISQSVVGPYEQTTLQSTNPMALYDWLLANSYEVQASMRPTIDAYVKAGFDFIALRLRPGQGVQAMQPVRVVTPGAGVTLPLRMVEAGVGAEVGIVLYVLGEGRYEARNFPNAVVDDSKLVWLTGPQTSNYQSVAADLMKGGGGRTFLTEFSQQVYLDGTPGYNPSCFGGGGFGSGSGGVVSSAGSAFSDLYFAQCECSSAATCDGDGGAQGDGGSGCAACDGYDDIALALQGMSLGGTWVTRLRAQLPTSALSAGDLDLQASASQQPVSNQHLAAVFDDPTYSPCGASSGSGCATAPDDRATGPWLLLGSFTFVGGSLLRRRQALRGRRPNP